MGITYTSLFPPAPTFTEKDLPSLSGKTFLITGGYSGIGFELSKILYAAGGKVYIAGRSKERSLKAIATIEETKTADSGSVHFLYVDLSDLATIKPAALEFTEKEDRLDVLFNNAGISLPAEGLLSKQGYEPILGTNCLGPFLLTQLLLPILKTTAKASPAGAVRVVFTSSITVGYSPAEGISIAHLDNPPKDPGFNYNLSKLGNWYLATELGRRVKDDGILSVTQDPGMLRSNLLMHKPWLVWSLRPVTYPTKMGAYTGIFSGFSGDLGMQNSGGFVLPWGRLHPAPRKDLLKTTMSKEEGGTGRAAEFWDWCENASKDFM